MGDYGRQFARVSMTIIIKKGEKMKIPNLIKFLIATLCIILIFSPGLTAQTQKESARSSVGINIGYFFPQGGWTQARINPSIRYFKKGISSEADLELAVVQWWTIVLSTGYTNLDVSEWENYASSDSNTLAATAGIVHFGVSVRPYLMSSSAFNVKAQLGLGYFLLEGEETYNSVKYDYDFLKSGFGLIAGIEIDQYLSGDAAVAVRLSYFLIPSGVEYADQSESHNVSGIAMTGGFRFNL